MIKRDQQMIVVQRIGARAWVEGTGSVPVASFTVTKLAWVAEHEPEALALTTKVMLPHDYLTWRLTGRHVTDRGDASGTGWFDPVTGRYRTDLLDQAVAAASGPQRIGEDWLGLLPTVLGPTEAAGPLLPQVASELGLPPSTVVGPGTGDNMGAALGLGLGPGDAVVSLGTSGTAYAVSDTPTRDQTGTIAGFADATGHFLPLVCTLNATKVTDTVAEWLGTDASGLADLALAAASAADRPGGADDGTSQGNERPILVPYFDGERTPNLPDSAGHVVGLRTTTTREDLALAAHDGVLCGLLDGLAALAEAGAETTGRLLLVGGGARSLAYRQRAADLAGRSVGLPAADEAVAAGAAVQAAATVSKQDPLTIASRWELDRAEVIEAATDGSEIRAGYRRAAAAVAGW